MSIGKEILFCYNRKMNFIELLLNIYYPQTNYPITARDKRDQKLFITFLFTSTVILLGFTFLAVVLNLHLPLYINFCGMGLLLAISIFYKLTGKLQISFFIYILTLMLIVTGQLLISSKNLSGNTIWIAIFIFLSGIVLPLWQTVILSILGTSLLALSYAIPIFFPEFQPTIYSDYEALGINIAIFISAAFSAILIAKLTLYEERFIQEWIAQRKEYFEKMSHNNAALMSMIGHDIATPLMLVENFMKKIKSPDYHSEKARQQLEKIKQLVDSIRQMNAVKSGKLELPLVEVDLKEICQQAMSDVLELANKKNITVLLHAPEDKYIVLADAHSLRLSVINNLLTNAIKFSYANQKIDIRLKTVGKVTVLRIQDYGIGIPVELERKLFDFSLPTTRTGTANEVGTGFGLPLVKLFVDIYGADIVVQSTTSSVNTGTIMEIRFREQDRCGNL